MAKKKFLNMMSQFRTLSIKVYDEQLPNGWETVCRIIRSLNNAELQVIAICHNRDYVTDEYWLPSVEKPHYHIIARILNNKRMRVNQILNTLGIVFRNEIDKVLWENHGVESCDNYTNMAMYLTHETEQAILDGKEKYELEELVSNLTIEEIRQIREGYTRVSDSAEKVTPAMLAQLDEDAYKLGYGLGDFDDWYGAQHFKVRSNAEMKTIKESYERGVNKRLESDETINRLCVYIESPHNKGKTYAAWYALRKLGVRYLPVGGGGTGKFDNLKVTHGGIVIDDDACPNLLNMSDMRYCRAYRRNKNNPPWVGMYLVVTSNQSFDDWAEEKCGIKNKENIEAARSRFYICHLEEVNGNNELVCTSPSSRGSVEVKQEVLKMYKAYRDYYNESLAEYHPCKHDVDYKGLNSEAYNEARKEVVYVQGTLEVDENGFIKAPEEGELPFD